MFHTSMYFEHKTRYTFSQKAYDTKIQKHNIGEQKFMAHFLGGSHSTFSSSFLTFLSFCRNCLCILCFFLALHLSSGFHESRIQKRGSFVRLNFKKGEFCKVKFLHIRFALPHNHCTSSDEIVKNNVHFISKDQFEQDQKI